MHAYICPDTGTLHIASAMKTPTIAIFGPSHPKRCAPYMNKNVLLHKACSYGPCAEPHLKKCMAKPACFEAITIKEIVNGLNKLGVLNE